MINKTESNQKKKYLLQFSPFFWRLGNINAGTVDKESQLRPVFVDGKESN
ncbi:hypothetical protein [Flagellimonas crocea]|nr:hypothetical protein [Muricauda sp. DH64]